MTSMMVLAILMTFLFGGMMLALVMGYAETERTRQQEALRSNDGVVRVAEEVPSFFATLDEAPHAAAPGAEHNGFVDHLEGYLKAEQALVARFVNDPTVDNLYRQATVSLSVN